MGQIIFHLYQDGYSLKLLSYCSMLVLMKEKNQLFGLDHLETINYSFLYEVTPTFTLEMTLMG